METNKRVTAVEWLEEKLWKLDDQNYTLPQWLVEQIDQAKAMEKEQIIEAINYGCSDYGSVKNAKQYYTSTYYK